MTRQRPLHTPCYVAIVVVGVLLAATGFGLLHSHKDSTDRGCQLCHVRHLPSVQTTAVVSYAKPDVSQRNWNGEHSAEELQVYVRNTSSRAPPAPDSFSL